MQHVDIDIDKHTVPLNVNGRLANPTGEREGMRVRDFPITLDKLLPELPLMEV